MIVHDIHVSDKSIRIGYIKNEKEYPQACSLEIIVSNAMQEL